MFHLENLQPCRYCLRISGGVNILYIYADDNPLYLDLDHSDLGQFRHIDTQTRFRTYTFYIKSPIPPVTTNHHVPRQKYVKSKI